MKNDFFLYSLPDQDFFQLIQNEGRGDFRAELKSFDSNSSLHFQSSNLQKIDLKGYFGKKLNLPKADETLVALQKSDYFSIFKNLQDKMKKENISKVIFSKIIKNNDEIDLFATLQNLKKAHPNTLVYLAYTPNSVWLGATPEELIVEGENNYRTMSLAGTLVLNENWTDKEKEEQQWVTHYISHKLDFLNVSYTLTEVQDFNQGNFKHLVQYFRIDKTNVGFEKIVDVLQPTPAVCGVPQEIAFKTINEIEPNNRSFYTGSILIKEQNKNYAYVNLRCAQLFENEQVVYVGGGITLDSQAEKEWEETEVKSKIILNNLALN